MAGGEALDVERCKGMTENRERDVTRAFVALATSLATGFDVADLLHSLTVGCVGLVDVESAGLLLADRYGILHVLAASSDQTRQLELFQLQRREGPCLDCYRAGAAIAVPDLRAAVHRWPQFVAAARAAGFASVHALPMRLRTTTLGTLGLFGTRAGALHDDDLALGQALADVASVALMQGKISADQAMLNEQLQHALTSRVVVEQAKGVLAQCADVDMERAFAMLRGYTRDNNLRLTDVAAAVVSHKLSAQEIISYSMSRE
jgi:transcriptional regulator with GAF, ATPase, and Fis domain